MLPKEPPKRPPLGFLFVPPYRVQGLSIAGEHSAVMVPELDVCFDIGVCPRAALPSPYVALSHAHMDHAAALSYYFSQRHFQGMGTGTLLCHTDIEPHIHGLMQAWVPLEEQRTPYNVIGMKPEDEHEIKNNIVLRAYATRHTVPSLGFIAIEKRSKLRSDLVGLEQEQLVELKQKGEQITQTHEIPLVCYTGDTAWGDHFERPDVLDAQILITECTFLDAAHRHRASVGKHLHLDHIITLLERSNAEAVILTHLSRRTHIGQARKVIDAAIPARHRDRLFLLMDTRTNRRRYEAQVAEAAQQQQQAAT